MADGKATTLDEALAAFDAWAATEDPKISMRQMLALEKILSALVGMDREMPKLPLNDAKQRRGVMKSSNVLQAIANRLANSADCPFSFGHLEEWSDWANEMRTTIHTACDALSAIAVSTKDLEAELAAKNAMIERLTLKLLGDTVATPPVSSPANSANDSLGEYDENRNLSR